ncbi:hypothetical protein ACPCUK_34355 [Streptomyces arboris]|uniref:hypothetical protein n=1 Tax=Streptomyces arboris TaxID=2600619 RepID=UPI003C301791
MTKWLLSSAWQAVDRLPWERLLTPGKTPAQRGHAVVLAVLLVVLVLITLVPARTVTGAVKSVLWRGRPPPPRPVRVVSAARPAGLRD